MLKYNTLLAVKGAKAASHLGNTGLNNLRLRDDLKRRNCRGGFIVVVMHCDTEKMRDEIQHCQIVITRYHYIQFGTKR
jgi:hypothetical protein